MQQHIDFSFSKNLGFFLSNFCFFTTLLLGHTHLAHLFSLSFRYQWRYLSVWCLHNITPGGSDTRVVGTDRVGQNPASKGFQIEIQNLWEKFISNPKSFLRRDWKSKIVLKVEFQIQNTKFFFFCDDRKPELSLNRHNWWKNVTV